MNIIRASRTSPHRLARLLAWARLMLAWIDAMLFATEPPRAQRRHIRRRYRLLDLDRMARAVGCLILIRACALARRLRTHACTTRAHAPRGFARRARPRHFVRSALGAALRRKLRHPDLRTRLAILSDAVANLDVYARMLLPRLMRRFTRLAPLILIRPSHDAASSAAPLRAPCPADTS